MPIKPRITISKTPGEWENIHSRLKEMNKSDIHGYVNNEVQKITKRFINDPQTIPAAKIELKGERKTIQFQLHHSTYLILKEISKKMDRPITSIIDELIIVPLHTPKL